MAVVTNTLTVRTCCALVALLLLYGANGATANDCQDTFNQDLLRSTETSQKCAALSTFEACVLGLPASNQTIFLSSLQTASLSLPECSSQGVGSPTLVTEDDDFTIQVPSSGSVRVERGDSTLDLFDLSNDVDQKATSADVEALEDRVDLLEGMVATLVSLLSSRPSSDNPINSLLDIRGIDNDVTTLLTKMSTADGKIEELEKLPARVQTNEDDIEAVEAVNAKVVATLTADPSTQSPVDSLVDIRVVTSDVGNLKTKMATSEGKIAELEKLPARIQTNEDDIDDLEKKTPLMDQRVGAVEARILSLENKDNTDVVDKVVAALHAGDGTGTTEEMIQNLLDLDQIKKNKDDIAVNKALAESAGNAANRALSDKADKTSVLDADDVNDIINGAVDKEQIKQNKLDAAANKALASEAKALAQQALTDKADASVVLDAADVRGIVDGMVTGTSSLSAKFAEDKVKTTAVVISTVEGMVGDGQSNALAEKLSSLATKTAPPQTLQIFRVNKGSWSTSTDGWKSVTATRFNLSGQAVKGSFYNPVKQKLKYQLHIGGDYTDDCGRKIYSRLACVTGSSTIYLPDATGHSVYKYVTQNRLDSETYDGLSPELNPGLYTCSLQINGASTCKYTWSSSYGEMSAIIGEVLPYDPSDARMQTQVPQQVLRIKSSSVTAPSSTAFVNYPGTPGQYIHPEDDLSTPYYVHVGGDYTDDCGHTVNYRIMCESDHFQHVVYLPDATGHKIYKYTDNSRLESEMFHGVTGDFRRGPYTCVAQVSSSNTGCRYRWSASYGEVIVVIGAQGNTALRPQQVYRKTSGSFSMTSTAWKDLGGSGTYTQSVANAPVHYNMHTGGDWVDEADRAMYYRQRCTSTGNPDVYLPDTTGHKIYKYIQHNRLESETFIGVTTAFKAATYTCKIQVRSSSTKPYNWRPNYGEMTLSVW